MLQSNTTLLSFAEAKLNSCNVIHSVFACTGNPVDLWNYDGALKRGTGGADWKGRFKSGNWLFNPFFRNLFLTRTKFHVVFLPCMLVSLDQKPLRVLVADDSASIRTLLSHTLEKWGYDVTVCSTGTEVWNYVRRGIQFNIMILDWIMPGMSGVELCQKIRSLNTDGYCYIILLTGNSTTNDIIEGLNSGADDYLVKPLSLAELKARVTVGNRMFQYEHDLRNKEQDVRISCYKTLTELAEARDYETGTHLTRIASLSRRLAEEAGCKPEFCRELEFFAPMHDIGKVGIPDGILHLPRKLTPVEFEIMKTHADIGYQILKDKETLETAAEIAWTHHERWNGSGYPRGIKGENIPLSGRIVSIVDVYDALRSVRPYKTRFSHEDSTEWIESQSGIAFDPDLIDAFKRCKDDLCRIFDSQYSEEAAEMLIRSESTDRTL